MALVDGLFAFCLLFPLYYTRRLKPVPRWTILILSVILVGALQSGWDTLLHHWSGKLLVYYNSAYEAFIRANTVNFYQAGMLLALFAFQGAYLEVRQQKHRVIGARDRERRAHMAALRFQLNPHFLFNSMNALSSLVVLGRNREAEEMIERLADFLRASLGNDPARLVRLEDEFDTLDSYLEIERTRFDERLETEIDLTAEVRDALIPAFLLQPLVENAMKYAVAPSSRPVTVSIAGEAEGDMLLLSVADTGAAGAGTVGHGTGVGLANIRERLQLEYDGAARLDLKRGADGFRAEIRLPLARALADAQAPAPAEAAE
jgi:LytS/YehU family sensor histidine kinase